MEEVDGGQAATPDAVGWDGTSLTPGHAGAAHDQDGGEPPALPSTPTRKGEEPRGDPALRVQDRWGPHKTVCVPTSPWRVALAGGTQPSPGARMDPAAGSSAGVWGPLSIPRRSGCSLQRAGAGSPFPRPIADICRGGRPRREGALPAQHLIMLPSWEETFSFAVW